MGSTKLCTHSHKLLAWVPLVLHYLLYDICSKSLGKLWWIHLFCMMSLLSLFIYVHGWKWCGSIWFDPCTSIFWLHRIQQGKHLDVLFQVKEQGGQFALFWFLVSLITHACVIVSCGLFVSRWTRRKTCWHLKPWAMKMWQYCCCWLLWSVLLLMGNLMLHVRLEWLSPWMVAHRHYSWLHPLLLIWLSCCLWVFAIFSRQGELP